MISHRVAADGASVEATTVGTRFACRVRREAGGTAAAGAAAGVANDPAAVNVAEPAGCAGVAAAFTFAAAMAGPAPRAGLDPVAAFGADRHFTAGSAVDGAVGTTFDPSAERMASAHDSLHATPGDAAPVAFLVERAARLVAPRCRKFRTALPVHFPLETALEDP
jgi:hypothetical protein